MVQFTSAGLGSTGVQLGGAAVVDVPCEDDSCPCVVLSLDPPEVVVVSLEELLEVVVSLEELLEVVVDPDAVVVSSGDLVAPSSLVGAAVVVVSPLAAVVVVSDEELEVVDC